jgi:hypothetical protein
MMWLITYIVNGYQAHQIIYGQGGPDAYGYVWKDQADAPSYNWIDPSSHQVVNGLSDDNFVGPFP